MRFADGLLILLATACAPGGKLGGTVATGTVDDWGFTDAVQTVQLETRPDAPYSISIWGVSSGGAFYIASQSWGQLFGGSGGDARWVDHIAADPRVRLRVGEMLYERKAIRVLDEGEVGRVQQLYLEKYGPEDWEEPAWVYRLDPR